MGWEQRGGRKYLYRVFRDEDGRVRREYLGAGAKAEAAAKALSRAQAEAKATKDAVKELTAQTQTIEADTKVLDQTLHDLITAELLLAGYYPHAGSWRRKHGRPKEEPDPKPGSIG